jgi:ABC-type dipeptide/oligopeptide/nickel transport system permease component
MKSAVLPGVIIGILSGIWLAIMRLLHIPFNSEHVSPVEFVSVLIPIVGLYIGVKKYRDTELKGNMNFLEALLQSFKILIVSGVLVVFLGIVYINYIESKTTNWGDFSGRIFAALLIGVLAALSASLLLMTRGRKVG